MRLGSEEERKKDNIVRYKRLILLLSLVFWSVLMPVANAEMCGVRNGHQICILKLKRSAKYYWEYRATVSIDGQRQRNQEIYNCRDRTLTRKGKYPIPFKSNSPGELVCDLFQK